MLSVVLAVLAVAGPASASDKDVVVRNTDAEAVPVRTVGAVTVGNLPAVQTVQVTGPVDVTVGNALLHTMDLRYASAFRTEAPLGASQPGTFSPPIPAGSRFVIEHMSAYVSLADGIGRPLIYAQLSGGSFNHNVVAPLEFAGSFPGSEPRPHTWLGELDVHAYADQLSVQAAIILFTTGDAPQSAYLGHLTLSGYLIPLPQ
jgi:hypothetical protein